MEFICYERCGTCAKARKWLDERKISYEERGIKTKNPTKEELREWQKTSGLPIEKFFNTSGVQYRELGLKDKLGGMTDDEKLALLATDGMLVKRPLLIGEAFALVGFKENEWADKLL